MSRTQTARRPKAVKNKGSSPGSTRWPRCASPTRFIGATARRRSTTGSASRWSTSGTFIRLNPELRPNSLSRPQPSQRRRPRRGPHLHLLREQADAGPTNNWMAPDEMKAQLTPQVRRLHAGRTMYVIPFSMGPVGSPIAHIGVQLTDSPYVVVNMRIMTRMGEHVLKALGDGEFVKCLHSVGMPLKPGRRTCPGRAARSEEQVHRPLPRGAGHLELRLRLRRQRAVGQEVLRPAHRLGHGPRRGLARRAHADLGREGSQRQEDLRRRRVPQRVRQDELRDAHSARRSSRTKAGR